MYIDGVFDQSPFDVRFEWGLNGLSTLSGTCDSIIIIDVLSFSTCVDIAVSNGATVYPYRWKDSRAEEYTNRINGVLAFSRDIKEGLSLSPVSMLSVSPNSRIVLPSPNGATLSLFASKCQVYTACIRNAETVAKFVGMNGKRIGVIASGERWEDDSIRPAIEDCIGAGAVISHLSGEKSPEALFAQNSFQSVIDDIPSSIANCVSGRELAQRGFNMDVILASELNVSNVVPKLNKIGFYENAKI